MFVFPFWIFITFLSVSIALDDDEEEEVYDKGKFLFKRFLLPNFKFIFWLYVNNFLFIFLLKIFSSSSLISLIKNSKFLRFSIFNDLFFFFLKLLLILFSLGLFSLIKGLLLLINRLCLLFSFEIYFISSFLFLIFFLDEVLSSLLSLNKSDAEDIFLILLFLKFLIILFFPSLLLFLCLFKLS